MMRKTGNNWRSMMNKMCWLLLGLSLMASCSEDDGIDSLNNPTDNADAERSMVGEFEGEWRLAPYGKVMSDGRIVVDEYMFEFDLPINTIFPLFGVSNEQSKSEQPDEPIFDPQASLTYETKTYCVEYSMRGYSANSFYISITSVDDGLQPSAFIFRVKANQVEYRVELIGVKEHATAQFDLITGLWSLSIPIDEMRIVNLQTGFQQTVNFKRDDVDEDISAWRLWFSSKRRIG